MPEKPKVVISRTRRAETPAKEFAFTQADIPAAHGAVASYRASAWEAFKRLALPDVTQEAWRRTDLHALPVDKFVLPKDGAYLDLPSVPEDLLKPLVADQHGGQILLMPGGATIDLDETLAKKGVIFTDFKTAQEKHPEIVAKILGQAVNVEEGKFAALAGALAQNGIVLYVPKNVQVEQPFHSILWGPGENFAHISHLLVLVEEGANVTYVHESASPTELKDALHAGIVEIKVMQGASLKFVELQSWGRHVWNFTHERARVERDGNLDWIFGAIGSRLTKNFSELDLVGEGAQGRMSGFYFTDGKQHLDHDTQQNHLAPHTTSDLLFKGALKGKSRSVWQGMIYVAKGAEKTDGYQANRNLVLEEGARADSIPGLEILADDVRCTHGATVGKLEQEPLFYIKTRGVPQKDAERVVVEGFFDPIMQRIPFEGVRERFQQAILEKMGIGNETHMVTKTKAAVKQKSKAKIKVRQARATSMPPRERRTGKLGRVVQFSYMKAPGVEHAFHVGDTVEVYCDHEKNGDRVRGWIKGIVVQVDNKMVAVQFRSNVFLTDGWMVPDRILWYPVHSVHIRPVASKKAGRKSVPDY